MSMPDLPESTRGSFSVETNYSTGERFLQLSFDFVASLPDDLLVAVIRWATDHLDAFNDIVESDKSNGDEVERAKPNPPMLARSPTDERGFVYVMKCGDAYKIGRSKNVSHRHLQISPIMPYPLEIILAIPTDQTLALERAFHLRFADKRLNGEWFNLSAADVETIKAYGK